MQSASGAARVTGFFKQVSRGNRASGRRGKKSQSRYSQRSVFYRRVVVKASIKRMVLKGTGPLRAHLDYVERSGTDKDGSAAKLFGRGGTDADKSEFVDRTKGDRHHFRFIISPEDAGQMQDLNGFTRDLVAQMESDLGTKLDWVAATHYDTGQPHTHLIIRGKRHTGEDLVIPRDYVSSGIRHRAQDLVSLELGPVSELEGRLRLAKAVQQERMTDMDREISRRTQNGVINLSGPVPHAKLWRRQLSRSRVKHLTKMGLATPLGKGRWQLAKGWTQTLDRMGAREDIIKNMHAAMKEAGLARYIHTGSIYDPLRERATPLTGQIIAKGLGDDVSDTAHLILDTTDGDIVYVEIGSADKLPYYERGEIISVRPPSLAPLQSDKTIAEIAGSNAGRYSPSLHMESDLKARPEFVEAHVRRLEAVRRAGLVTRHSDGQWSVPGDYLERAANYQSQLAARRPLGLERHSRLTLAQMTESIGATWLDATLLEENTGANARGFGKAVAMAQSQRRRFLIDLGYMKPGDAQLGRRAYAALRHDDLAAAGTKLRANIGKPYEAAVGSGRISGVYRQSIERPSGRFAVIESERAFTLVPWRDVMENNLGQSISGHLRGKTISWRLSKGLQIS